METISERRTRKLIALAKAKGGIGVIADDCDLSTAALDQVVKGTLLPAKSDGTRSKKALGNKAARAIEERYGLGRGWFDIEDASAMPAAPDHLQSALAVVAKSLAESDRFARVWPKVSRLLSEVAEEPEQFGNFSQRVEPLLGGEVRPESVSDNEKTTGSSFSVVLQSLESVEANAKHSPVQKKNTR